MSKFVRYNHGHGESDSGAVGKYKGKTIYERDVAENIVKDVVAYQKKNYTGMTISFGVEKPNGDFPKNSNGTYNAKAYGTKEGGYYSFHLNASSGSGHGTETWYWKIYGDKRARVVNDVLDNYFTDRDVKLADTNQDGYADFYILRECGFDTIVEIAFIDNENDMEILFSKWDEIIKSIGDSIAKYEGWKRKETVKKYYSKKTLIDSQVKDNPNANYYQYMLSAPRPMYDSNGKNVGTLSCNKPIYGYKKTKNGCECVMFSYKGYPRWSKMAEKPNK